MRGQHPAAPGLRGRRRFGPAGHSPPFSGGAGWTFGTCSLCRDPREVEAACQDRCRGRPCGSCRRPSLAPRVRRAERPVGTQGSVTRAEPGLGCFVEELARRPGPARRPGCTWGAQGPRRLRTRCVGGLPGPPGHPRRPRRGTKGCPDVSANKLEGSNVLKSSYLRNSDGETAPLVPRRRAPGSPCPAGEVPRLDGGPLDGQDVRRLAGAGERLATLSSCLGDKPQKHDTWSLETPFSTLCRSPDV